jgi:hypothetical protein
MDITFTLQAGSSMNVDSFQIYAVETGGSSYLLANNISRTQLSGGHTIYNASNNITGGTINSTGMCSTSVNWSTTPSPTPSPTVTITPTTLFNGLITVDTSQADGTVTVNSVHIGSTQLSYNAGLGGYVVNQEDLGTNKTIIANITNNNINNNTYVVDSSYTQRPTPFLDMSVSTNDYQYDNCTINSSNSCVIHITSQE